MSLISVAYHFSVSLRAWHKAVEQITTTKRAAAAPVLRQRVRILLPYLGTGEVTEFVLKVVDALVSLAPDEGSATLVGDVLNSKYAPASISDAGLAALVAIYPRAKGAVCVQFGRLAKKKDPDFLTKLAGAAAGLKDKRLATELSPLRFHPSPEVREAAEAVFRQ
jgi:hypothetical protein